jgi:hypothetical protein
MNYKISRYGWLPGLPDYRDYLYAAPVAFTRAVPVKADLRLDCPPVYDQGQLGSCFTGNTYDDAKQWFIVRNSWGFLPVISGQFVLLRDYMETTLIKL